MAQTSKHLATYREVLAGQRARAGLGAPLRDSFFMNERDGVRHHPLASLMSGAHGPGGGRGGRSRVLLYLSLLWVVGGGDHSTTRSARFWAELLNFDDPAGSGSRLVRSSWVELENRGFVTIARGPAGGDTWTLRPLREDGSGAAYSIPSGQDGDFYRRIPEACWRAVFRSRELTGPGLCMYLAALRAHGLSGGKPFVFPRMYFQQFYGLGESTRRKGLRNLAELLVLDQVAISRETGPAGERRRGRAWFELYPDYEPPAARPAN